VQGTASRCRLTHAVLIPLWRGQTFNVRSLLLTHKLYTMHLAPLWSVSVGQRV